MLYVTILWCCVSWQLFGHHEEACCISIPYEKYQGVQVKDLRSVLFHFSAVYLSIWLWYSRCHKIAAVAPANTFIPETGIGGYVSSANTMPLIGVSWGIPYDVSPYATDLYLAPSAEKVMQYRFSAGHKIRSQLSRRLSRIQQASTICLISPLLSFLSHVFP